MHGKKEQTEISSQELEEPCHSSYSNGVFLFCVLEIWVRRAGELKLLVDLTSVPCWLGWF